MFRDRTEEFRIAASHLPSPSPPTPSSSYSSVSWTSPHGSRVPLPNRRRPNTTAVAPSSSSSSSSSHPRLVTTVTAPHATTTPEWIREYPQISAELDDAEDRLRALRALYITAQQQVVTPSRDIEHHAAAALHAIKNAQQYVAGVSDEAQHLPSGTLRTTAHHTAQGIRIRCEDMYRELQHGLAQHRRERERLERRLVQLKGRDSAAEEREQEAEAKEALLQRQGLSDDQVTAVMENEALIRKRGEEMKEVMKEMEDVQGLFKDLGEMVREQDDMVNRIDANVDHTHRDVHRGEEEVAAAEQYQRAGDRSRRICMIVFLVIIATLVFIGFMAV